MVRHERKSSLPGAGDGGPEMATWKEEADKAHRRSAKAEALGEDVAIVGCIAVLGRHKGRTWALYSGLEWAAACFSRSPAPTRADASIGGGVTTWKSTSISRKVMTSQTLRFYRQKIPCGGAAQRFSCDIAQDYAAWPSEPSRRPRPRELRAASEPPAPCDGAEQEKAESRIGSSRCCDGAVGWLFCCIANRSVKKGSDAKLQNSAAASSVIDGEFCRCRPFVFRCCDGRTGHRPVSCGC